MFDQVELIWGDCGSTDGTAEMLGGASDIAHVVPFRENLGFAGGNNRLAGFATGEILVFLNYDVVLTPDWLRELVTPFDGRPGLGIVGNVQFSVRARAPDHAGIFFDDQGAPRHFRPRWEALQNLRLLPAPAVTGACLAIRRELFDRLRGFDEGYANSYEDIDLCLRARQAGAGVAVATRSVIWHYIGSSPGRQDHEQANARRFASRWRNAIPELRRLQAPVLRAPAVSRPDPDPSTLQQTAQVFFPDPSGYSESASSIHLYRVGRWSRIEISLPATAQGVDYRLRLDPGTEVGQFSIGGVSIRSGPERRLIWQASGAGLLARIRLDGTSRRIATGRGFLAESTGVDPQIIISIPSEAVAHLAKDILTASVWLRWHERDAKLDRRPRARRAWIRFPVRRRPVRVLVDLSALQPGGRNGGIKVFALELLRALTHGTDKRELRFTAATTKEVATELGSSLMPARIQPWHPQTSASPEQASHGADVLYAPVGFSPFARPGLPQVSLIVDLLHRDLPEMLPPDEVANRERWMTETLACSDLLQCNSRFVVDRLRHHYGIEAERTLVVYNAVQRPPTGDRPPIRPSERPYFFYPANDWPHKNHLRLIEAFAHYCASCASPWSLKLTGHFHWPDRIAKAIEQHGISRHVQVLGHVPGAAFAELLSGAGALAFPSLYEGFGIPLVEAFAAGVPVLASKAASLPEVGGDACLFVDAANPEELAQGLTRIADDANLRERLVAAGRVRTGQFSLAAEARKVADALVRVGRAGRET